MKVKLTHLLILCLFIIEIYNSAVASMPAHSFVNTSVQANEAKHGPVFDRYRYLIFLSEYSFLNETDDDTVPVRKKTTISRYYSALNNILILNYFAGFFKLGSGYYDCLYYLSHDKYIFQKVLKV